MPAFTLDRSIFIDAPIDAVFAKVRDLKGWPGWSPWVIAEPNCPIEYSEDGKSYSWEGAIIGAGKLEILDEDAPTTMDYRLTFLKPWKNVASGHFRLVEKDGGTEVTWRMNGSLPWFMFFFKGMMTAFIGMDFERGLKMLKDDIETGDVPSQLEFASGQNFPGCQYIGIRHQCAIPEMGAQMEKDMEKLRAWLSESGNDPTGQPLSVYHKWKPTKGMAEYTLGFPLANPPAIAPDDFVVGEIPPGSTYTITHTGPYRHLGNAWSSGMMHAQSKVFAKNNKLAPFEIYENTPADTPENELVTIVHLPTK